MRLWQNLPELLHFNSFIYEICTWYPPSPPPQPQNQMIHTPENEVMCSGMRFEHRNEVMTPFTRVLWQTDRNEVIAPRNEVMAKFTWALTLQLLYLWNMHLIPTLSPSSTSKSDDPYPWEWGYVLRNEVWTQEWGYDTFYKGFVTDRQEWGYGTQEWGYGKMNLSSY